MCSFNLLVSVILLVITCLPTSRSIQCFKCSIVAPPTYLNEPKRLCSDFDYSEKYIVDCPYSTLCMKKTYTVSLTKPINGTLRDCASQMHSFHAFENGKWEKKVSIEEPYEEGCATVDDKGLRSSVTTFCYCRTPLCNTGTKTYSFASVVLTVISSYCAIITTYHLYV